MGNNRKSGVNRKKLGRVRSRGGGKLMKEKRKSRGKRGNGKE